MLLLLLILLFDAFYSTNRESGLRIEDRRERKEVKQDREVTAQRDGF
jgi:hypothetical protein